MKGGVPMSYRGQLWISLVGNELRINSQVFEEFQSDYTFGRTSDMIKETIEKEMPSKWDPKNNTQSSPDSMVSKSKSFSKIGSVKKDSLLLKDIPRTFPHLNQLFE